MGHKHLGILRLSKFVKSEIYLFHIISISPDMGSSHPRLSRHICWRTCFPNRINGERKPRGSKREAITDRLFRRVFTFSVGDIRNSRLSESAHHLMPKTLSTGRRSRSKFKYFIEDALSLSGMESNTSLLFEINLCNQSHPALHTFLDSFIR